MTEELEIKLMKFADSELSPDEEAGVLLDCEQSPEQWKNLALAMITQRRLTEALAGFTEGGIESYAQQPPRATRGSGSVSGWTAAGKSFAVSLALLLAFLVGRYQVEPAVPPAEIANVRPLPGAQTDQEEQQPFEPPDVEAEASETMLADSNVSEPFQTYETVNPWTVVSKPVITDEDRGAFSDAGLDVEEQNTIYIVSDADGGRWAIPWKAVNVRYSPNQ